MNDRPTVPALVIGTGETQVRLITTPSGEPMMVLDRMENGEFVAVLGLMFTSYRVAFDMLEGLAVGLNRMIGGRKLGGTVH